MTQLDCDVAQQCSDCECDAESCCGSDREWNRLEIDAALTDGGDTLEGTLLMTGVERVILRMVR
jgi:hypothetical protein